MAPLAFCLYPQTHKSLYNLLRETCEEGSQVKGTPRSDLTSRRAQQAPRHAGFYPCLPPAILTTGCPGHQATSVHRWKILSPTPSQSQTLFLPLQDSDEILSKVLCPPNSYTCANVCVCTHVYTHIFLYTVNLNIKTPTCCPTHRHQQVDCSKPFPVSFRYFVYF